MKGRFWPVAVATAGLLAFAEISACAQAGSWGVNGTIPRQNKPYLGKNLPSQQSRDWQVTPHSLRFMKEAARDSAAEIKLARLALDRSSNSAVREFAQRMIDDHTKANRQLMHLARDKGITLSTAPTAEENATYDRLASLHGAAFDRAYARMMVQDHEKAVHMFQALANNGRNSDLRTWAGDTQLTLRTHLTLARRMADAVGVGSGRHAMNR